MVSSYVALTWRVDLVFILCGIHVTLRGIKIKTNIKWDPHVSEYNNKSKYWAHMSVLALRHPPSLPIASS